MKITMQTVDGKIGNLTIFDGQLIRGIGKRPFLLLPMNNTDHWTHDPMWIVHIVKSAQRRGWRKCVLVTWRGLPCILNVTSYIQGYDCRKTSVVKLSPVSWRFCVSWKRDAEHFAKFEAELPFHFL